MTEASLHYDGEPRECGEDDRANLSVRSSEFRVTPSRSSAEVGDIGNEAVMAAPAKKPERKVRSSKNSRKASLEDQMEERMRSSIETRFSSFEEKMLGMMADFQRQQKSVNSSLTATSTVTNNVCSAQGSTSGACQPTVTRTNTLGAGNGRRNVISLDNSLNDEQFGSRSPVQRDWPDDDDILSLQPGQGESRDLDLDSHSNASEQQKTRIVFLQKNRCLPLLGIKKKIETSLNKITNRNNAHFLSKQSSSYPLKDILLMQLTIFTFY